MKYLLMTCALLWMSASQYTMAQQPWGVQSSNYGGVYRAGIQPASLANSKVQWELNLVGLSFDAWNNYIEMPTGFVNGFNTGNFLNETNDLRTIINDDLDGNEKVFHFDTQIQGPSLMFSPSRKWGIALTTRMRLMTNMSSLDEELVKQVIEQQEYEPFFSQRTEINGTSIQALGYGEIGLSLGLTLLDAANYSLKGGVTVKNLTGFMGGTFYANSGAFEVYDSLYVGVEDIDINYAYSSLVDDLNQGQSIDPLDYLRGRNNGWGMDIGAVFEFRPNNGAHLTRDGKNRRDKDHYTLRLGASLLDVGGINFDRSVGSKDFQGTADSLNFRDLPFANFDSLATFIETNFQTSAPTDEFRLTLPTRLCVQADYKISQKLAVEGIFLTAFGQPDEKRVKAQTTIAVIPRFETKQLGISIPISWPSFDKVNMGVSVRVGPLFLGANNLLSILTQDYVQSANYYGGLRVMFPWGKGK